MDAATLIVCVLVGGIGVICITLLVGGLLTGRKPATPTTSRPAACGPCARKNRTW